MKTKIIMWAAVGACSAIYAAAYWCEAAYYAGRMGFNEVISWSRLAGALPAVSQADFVKAETMPHDFLILLGVILVAVLAGGLHRTSWRAAAPWILAAYSVSLILGVGWMGVLMLLMPGTIDGEFFAENCARLSAIGIWSIVVMALTIAAWRRERQEHRTSASNATALPRRG